MRVIKTLSKQIDLAAQGKLFIIVNASYKAVTPEGVRAMQGVKFYARAK
jgi:hypothetical protein